MNSLSTSNYWIFLVYYCIYWWMKACMMDGWMEACMCYILNAIATCISSCPTEWLKTSKEWFLSRSKEWFLSREGLSEPAGCTHSCPGTVPARNGCSCNRTSPYRASRQPTHISVGHRRHSISIGSLVSAASTSKLRSSEEEECDAQIRLKKCNMA